MKGVHNLLFGQIFPKLDDNKDNWDKEVGGRPQFYYVEPLLRMENSPNPTVEK